MIGRSLQLQVAAWPQLHYIHLNLPLHTFPLSLTGTDTGLRGKEKKQQWLEKKYNFANFNLPPYFVVHRCV